MTTYTVSRRDFVVVLTATGGGLLLGCQMGERSGAATAAAAASPPDFAPNGFIRIASDGQVTLIMNQVEMGQGTYTSMPMLLAEELEVGLDQVQLEHAPPNDKLYANPLFGDQETGASTSVRERPGSRSYMRRRAFAKWGVWISRRISRATSRSRARRP